MKRAVIRGRETSKTPTAEPNETPSVTKSRPRPVILAKDRHPKASSEKLREKSLPVRSASPSLKPPKELAAFFANPPLVGDEGRAEYETLFAAIADAVKPQDAIAWVYVGNITDLCLDIRRERNARRHAMNSSIRKAVESALQSMYWKPLDENEEAAQAMRKWESDPDERRKINQQLAEWGCDETRISDMAFSGRNSDLDGFDARIAFYEARFRDAQRGVEQYSQKFARRLEAAVSAVIEGEFSEAAE